MISVDSQDLIDDLVRYKERALNTYLIKVLPKFMLKTPGMRRRAKAVDTLVTRVQGGHTPAQRAGCPRDLADDLLSLHASDPQLVPESNLRFALSAAAIASVYLGDAFSFTVYAMASQPELYERIREEADAPVCRWRPSPGGFHAGGDRRYPSLPDGMSPYVSHRSYVYANGDEFLHGGRLRNTGGVDGVHRSDRVAFYEGRFPGTPHLRH